MKKSFALLVSCLLLCLVSCGDNDPSGSTVTVSSDTELKSLSFTYDSDNPGLSRASFTIDLSTDTALVYNVDSLPFGTRIDSVVSTFYFKNTVGYAIFYSDTDSVVLRQNDTLNFTPRPCRLYVRSSDYTAERWYHIYLNVHQVDPDLFTWKQLPSLPAGSFDYRMVEFAGERYIYQQDGLGACVYRMLETATSPLTYQLNSLTGLPANVDVRTMVATPQALYVAHGNKLYTSADVFSWNEVFLPAGITGLTTIAYFHDALWLAVREGEKTYLATWDGSALQSLETRGITVTEFPVSDFACCTFSGVTGRPRMMIMGGHNDKGEALNTRWNIEFRADKDGGVYRMTDFTVEQPNFASLTGASLVAYDDRIYLFGGVDADAQVGEYPILESIDEGLHWTIPDSAHNVLPHSYLPRQRQAALRTADNFIYLVGGQSRTAAFNDVYRGIRNDINW